MDDSTTPVTAADWAADAGASVTSAAVPAAQTTPATAQVTSTAAPAVTAPAAPAAATPPTPDGGATPVVPSTTTPADTTGTASTDTAQPFVTLSNSQYNDLGPKAQANYDAQKAAAQKAGTAMSQAPLNANTWSGYSGAQKAAYIAANPNSPEAAQAAKAAAAAAAAAAANTGGYSTPAPAQASDYVSDQSFIPAVPANEPTATAWTVTPDQTVQGQMDQLTTKLQTNPVYQSLADQLKRTSAAAGGGNSLMAETSAYNSVIGLAYNIATSDAATYAKSAEFNASMANQFGLAEQQFMNTALLSDQNYKQSQVLQSEQIKGNLDSVDRQIAGQIQSTTIAGQAEVDAAGAQITAAGMYASASIQDAQLSAATSLQESATQQQTTLDGLQIQFQSNWALNQQGQANQLQTIGAQAGAQIDVNSANNADQFAKSLTLQNNADYNANLRQLMSGISTIGATPGLTADQQSNAISTETSIFQTNSALTNAAAGSTTYGLQNGSIGTGPSSSVTPTAQNPYGIYGNYMAFPGFTMTAPPTLPFYSGTGTSTAPVNQQPPQAMPSIGGNFIPPTTANPPQTPPT